MAGDLHPIEEVQGYRRFLTIWGRFGLDALFFYKYVGLKQLSIIFLTSIQVIAVIRLLTAAVAAGLVLMTFASSLAQSPDQTSSTDLFLLAGQSNMAGRGEVQPQDKEEHPRVWAMNAESEWEPAVSPIHFDKPIAGVGPGRTFGISMADHDSTAVIGLIPTAVGGSAIETWTPGGVHEGTGIHPYDAAIERTKAAMEDGELKAILWHQGEADCTPERAPQYKDRLIDLIRRFREDLGDPDLPFIIGQLGQFEGQTWSDARSTVNEAHIEVAAEVPNVAFVSSIDLTAKPDGVHFDAESAREFGRRYAEVYRKLVD